MNEFAKSHGANLLILTEVCPFGKADEKFFMTDEMKNLVIQELDRLKLLKSIFFSLATAEGACTYQRKLRMYINAKGFLSFCHFLPMPESKIADAREKHILELIQANNKVRQGFLKSQQKMFSLWHKPRLTSGQCSYCVNSFGLQKGW